ncbi:MAG: tetratricopeptide repeat protein [Candidatus Obscuribacterales bacterium]|nr:tetratricopeptide repeat protein [Candidatus Obscuribacterales bacterium]
MKIMDLFKRGNKTEAKETSAVVKKSLFDAIINNHLTDFDTLCLKHEEEIFANFADWKSASEDLRADDEAYQLNVRCLQIVANYFLRNRMKGELHAILTGLDDSPETIEWRNRLTEAEQLMAELKYEQALPLLESCLAKSAQSSSVGMQTLRPLTLGCIGECFFQLAQGTKAIKPLQDALSLAEEQRDSDSVLQYLRSLYEVHRYLGDPAAAAGYALRLSEVLEERGLLIPASNWRHQGRAIKNGEPPLRAVVKIGEELFELNDIPVVQSDKVEFLPMRSRTELKLSMQLCDEGRGFAEQTDVDTALQKFAAAKKADPLNYWPHYYSAAVFMHQNKFEEAVKAYEKTEELCPGWENTRSELWLARQMAAGHMQEDVYKSALVFLNDQLPVEERVRACKETLAKYPDYAECYLKLGKIEALAGNKEEARALLEKGIAVAAEPDVKSRLLCDLALLTADNSEKLALLKSCIEIENGNLVGQALAHYLLRQIEG